MGFFPAKPELDSAGESISSVNCSRLAAQTPIGAPFGKAILSTKYWDSDTKTYAFQLRDYGPGIAKWLSRDPMEDEVLYVYVNNATPNSADFLGLFKVDTTWGEWSIGVAAYKVWGFDFGCSFKKESEDCCDKDGNLVTGGFKRAEIDCKLEIGIGVGGEIRFMKKGWKNPKVISKLVKGPQIYGRIKDEFKSAYCGGPLDGKACGQFGIDAGASASFGYIIFSASVDSGVRGYVEVCIDTDGNWDAKFCGESHLGIDVSVGVGPISKTLISKRANAGPRCIPVGSGDITL